MALKMQPIKYQILQSDEIEILPERVRLNLGEGPEQGDEWIVLHAPAPVSGLVGRFVKLTAERDVTLWRSHSGSDLDRVLGWLTTLEPGVEADLAVDNLALRLAYVDETPTLTAEQIHQMSGRRSRNKSEPASRWKKEGKTFAVRLAGRFLYPAFQFEHGEPRHVVRAVLAALPAEMTSWQKAFWFASGSGWLDGDEPQRRLDDGERVVEAARRLAVPALG